MIVEAADYSLLSQEDIQRFGESYMAPDRWEERKKMRNLHAIQQSVAAESLLYQSLAEHGRLPKEGDGGLEFWQGCEWKIRSGGKPEIPALAPLGFNLSHSGRMVACVWAEEEVGVDIQQISRVRESVARRYYSEEEKSLLESASNREEMFHLLWSRREAVVKFLGTGLGLDFTRIRWKRVDSVERQLPFVDDVYLDGEWVCRSTSVVCVHPEVTEPMDRYALTVCSEEAWDGTLYIRNLKENR